ncbi:hypothetical protein IPC785_01650 [Pseudomonas aeruginosa]|nr:hypothetical protein IPC785_01650 [Pseudomonas aeruginosa]
MLRFDAGVFVFPLILRALRLISAAIVLFLLKLQALTCRVWRKVRPLASQLLAQRTLQPVDATISFHFAGRHIAVLVEQRGHIVQAGAGLVRPESPHTWYLLVALGFARGVLAPFGFQATEANGRLDDRVPVTVNISTRSLGSWNSRSYCRLSVGGRCCSRNTCSTIGLSSGNCSRPWLSRWNFCHVRHLSWSNNTSASRSVISNPGWTISIAHLLRGLGPHLPLAGADLGYLELIRQRQRAKRLVRPGHALEYLADHLLLQLRALHGLARQRPAGSSLLGQRRSIDSLASRQPLAHLRQQQVQAGPLNALRLLIHPRPAGQNLLRLRRHKRRHRPPGSVTLAIHHEGVRRRQRRARRPCCWLVRRGGLGTTRHRLLHARPEVPRRRPLVGELVACRTRLGLALAVHDESILPQVGDARAYHLALKGADRCRRLVHGRRRGRLILAHQWRLAERHLLLHAGPAECLTIPRINPGLPGLRLGPHFAIHVAHRPLGVGVARGIHEYGLLRRWQRAGDVRRRQLAGCPGERARAGGRLRRGLAVGPGMDHATTSPHHATREQTSGSSLGNALAKRLVKRKVLPGLLLHGLWQFLQRALGQCPLGHPSRQRLAAGLRSATSQQGVHIADTQLLRRLAAQAGERPGTEAGEQRCPRLLGAEQAIIGGLANTLCRLASADGTLANGAKRPGRQLGQRSHPAPNSTTGKHRRCGFRHGMGDGAGVRQHGLSGVNEAFGLRHPLVCRLLLGRVEIVEDLLCLFRAKTQPLGSLAGLAAGHDVGNPNRGLGHADRTLQQRDAGVTDNTPESAGFLLSGGRRIERGRQRLRGLRIERHQALPHFSLPWAS